MKVLFNTYPMAFHTPGGGEIQLLAYERHLPAFDVQVTRADLWNPRFLDHDLVHFFSCIGGSSHYCGFVKQLGLPLLVSASLWMTKETSAQYPIAEIRHQLELADRVITNSSLESEMLARLLDLPPGKFAVVPNAVEERFLIKADPALFRTTFQLHRPFVLTVANIEPRKNQMRLIEAMRQHPSLDLVLIGAVRDPDYWDQVQRRAGTQLHYVGAIPHDSPLLPSAYAACESFVLPSLFETPGLAALEAAGQGARIAVTSGGSTVEYFGEAARYLDPSSVESIADAIGSVGQSGTGYRPATWSDAAATLAGIYSSVLSAKA